MRLYILKFANMPVGLILILQTQYSTFAAFSNANSQTGTLFDGLPYQRTKIHVGRSN